MIVVVVLAAVVVVVVVAATTTVVVGRKARSLAVAAPNVSVNMAVDASTVCVKTWTR